MKLFEKSLTKLHRSLKSAEQEIKGLQRENKAPKVAKQSKLRERLTAVAGLVILLLAVAGIFFCGLFFTHVHNHKKETAYQQKIEYYTDFISPVVLFDTGEFADLNNANNLSLLIPSFFRAQETVYADLEERESVTATDVSSRYIIREADIQQAANELFGRTVICQSFTLDGLTFEYVENEKYFLSPITVRIAMYEPAVKAMEDTDKGTELTVDYVEVAAGQSNKVGKTMKIVLQGTYPNQTIEAVTAAPAQ